MLSDLKTRKALRHYGGDILRSAGMQAEKQFVQHGQISVYSHSVAVASQCLKMDAFFHTRADRRALIRGALLHDYFLYDWHIHDGNHKMHGFTHAGCAAGNAQRDFGLTPVEENMIRAHMFPLNWRLPRYRESVILCLSDKICATRETVAGYSLKLKRLWLM